MRVRHAVEDRFVRRRGQGARLAELGEAGGPRFRAMAGGSVTDWWISARILLPFVSPTVTGAGIGSTANGARGHADHPSDCQYPGFLGALLVRPDGRDSAFPERKKPSARTGQARGGPRGVTVAPLWAVEDPRDVAAILMVLIARANGDPTRERIARSKTSCVVFGFQRELTERMTQARFIAQQTDSLEQAAACSPRMFRSG